MIVIEIFLFCFLQGTKTTSRRGRKKAKVTPVKKSENIESTVPTESIQTNDEDIEKIKDDHSTTEPKVRCQFKSELIHYLFL